MPLRFLLGEGERGLAESAGSIRSAPNPNGGRLGMNGDPFSPGGAAIRALVADLGPCLDGSVAERHDEILAEIQAFASAAKGELGRERTGRAAAEAEAK